MSDQIKCPACGEPDKELVHNEAFGDQVCLDCVAVLDKEDFGGEVCEFDPDEPTDEERLNDEVDMPQEPM